jgi:hypothetical protein
LVSDLDISFQLLPLFELALIVPEEGWIVDASRRLANELELLLARHFHRRWLHGHDDFLVGVLHADGHFQGQHAVGSDFGLDLNLRHSVASPSHYITSSPNASRGFGNGEQQVPGSDLPTAMPAEIFFLAGF